MGERKREHAAADNGTEPLVMILKPTRHTQVVNSQECRIFEGVTHDGARVRVHVAAITPIDCSPEAIEVFESELRRMPPTRLIQPAIVARPRRRVRRSMLVARLEDGGTV
jgi:hypothetical protein